MALTKTDIFVYAHWIGMQEPVLMGKNKYCIFFDKVFFNRPGIFFIFPD